MRRTHLIAIGAVSIDTILTVPYFPQEDAKLRATHFIRRRGGNSPNSLEGLGQLLQLEDGADVELSIVAPLPAKNSRDNEFIQNSFSDSQSSPSKARDGHISGVRSRQRVNLDYCLYREDCSEAISSYIIASEAKKTRTIVNHNPLLEMTFEEFISVVETIIKSIQPLGSEGTDERLWFHFEGRIPETTLKCIRYLRTHPLLYPSLVRISVELERPGREGLQALALEADVVFYSRSWAEGEGYPSAEVCLQEQARILNNDSGNFENRLTGDRLLVCTWGSFGASAITIDSQQPCTTYGRDDQLPAPHVEHSAAYISPDKPIVDTTGAGDTFIAGVLFGLICRGEFAKTSERWSTQRVMEFANGLAGRKILRYGFRVDDVSLGPV